MAAFVEILHDGFSWCLRSTFEASLLIAVIMILQYTLARRLPAKWHYGLWLILVARMLMPWGPESAFSLFNALPDAAPASQMSVSETTDLEAADAFEDWMHWGLSEGADAQAPRRPALPQAPSLPPLPVLPAVWMLGFLAFAGHLLYLNLRFWWTVRHASPTDDPHVVAVLKSCRARLGIRRQVRIVPCEAVRGPALFGTFRPRLLIPRAMLARLSPDELRFVLLHELAHLKRHDVAMTWLTTVLQAIHWFNPLVWYAFYRMRLDRELACDALALAHTDPGESEGYGRTIIRLLEEVQQMRRVPGMTGILEDKSQLRRRITMIALFKKNSIRWTALGVALLVIVASVALTDAKRIDPDVQTVREALLDARSRARTLCATTDQYLGLERFDTALDDLTSNGMHTVAIEGEKVYIRVKYYTDGGLVLDEIESFDGTLSKSLFPLSKTCRINKDMPGHLTTCLLPIPWRFPVGSGDLLTALEQDEVEVASKSDTKYGTPMWVLSGKDRTAPKYLGYRVYVDPALGFMPRAMEVLRTTKTPAEITRVIRLMEYREVEPGLWIPHRLEGEGHRGETISARNVYAVSALSVNEPIEEGLFTIDFPPNYEVIDERLGEHGKVVRKAAAGTKAPVSNTTPAAPAVKEEEATEEVGQDARDVRSRENPAANKTDGTFIPVDRLGGPAHVYMQWKDGAFVPYIPSQFNLYDLWETGGRLPHHRQGAVTLPNPYDLPEGGLKQGADTLPMGYYIQEKGTQETPEGTERLVIHEAKRMVHVTTGRTLFPDGIKATLHANEGKFPVTLCAKVGLGGRNDFLFAGEVVATWSNATITAGAAQQKKTGGNSLLVFTGDCTMEGSNGKALASSITLDMTTGKCTMEDKQAAASVKTGGSATNKAVETRTYYLKDPQKAPTVADLLKEAIRPLLDPNTKHEISVIKRVGDTGQIMLRNSPINLDIADVLVQALDVPPSDEASKPAPPVPATESPDTVAQNNPARGSVLPPTAPVLSPAIPWDYRSGTRVRSSRASAKPVRRKSIKEALTAPISIDFDGVHISEIVEYMAESLGVNIVVDYRVVAPPGTTGTLPEGMVSDGIIRHAKLRDLPAGEVLSAMLRPLRLDYGVGKSNFVWISTPEKLRTESFEKPETRTYMLKNAATGVLPGEY